MAGVEAWTSSELSPHVVWARQDSPLPKKPGLQVQLWIIEEESEESRSGNKKYINKQMSFFFVAGNMLCGKEKKKKLTEKIHQYYHNLRCHRNCGY